MAEALIGLGGNVGDARSTIAQGIDRFCDGKEVRLIARSADYKTPPWGVTRQPPFINACMIVQTALPPRDLLTRAQAVESAFGRDRSREQHWGPRSLDIDILAYDHIKLNEPGLMLPHPRLLERAFVLVPLAEIAPERMISGIRVDDALKRVDAGGIERLA